MAQSDSVDSAAERLQAAMNASPDEVKREGWEGIWKGGLQPGQKFDASRMSPVVAAKLQSGELDVRGKHVLVPGCGRGYDVVGFVRAGAASAVGLEIAPTAVLRANEYRDSCNLDAELADKARFEQADFFEYEPAGGAVDVGYDYTFLCALQPEQRRQWAATWARLLRSGGELVTLIFPVDSSRPADVGPPFPVEPALYRDLLLPAGFEEASVEKVPEELSHEGRGGKEFLGRWRRL